MKRRHVVMVGLVVLVAGCSSSKGAGSPSTSAPARSSSASTSSTGPTTTELAAVVAQQYLTAAEGADAAYVQWKAAVAGKTQVSEIAGPAATYAGQMTTFDGAIAQLGATGKAKTDISALVADDRVVIGELNSVSSQTESGLAQWAGQLTSDGAEAIRAGDVVRADLGLPPS